MDFGKVNGKLAFVTGGASGIGKASCLLLAKLGATVIVTDLNLDQCEITKKELADQSLNHSAYKLDVTCVKSIQKVVEDLLTKYKRPPTIIINSAGIAGIDGIGEVRTTECPEEAWNKVIDVNLKGTFLINKTFAKLMKEASIPGSIVNISSLARDGYPKGIPYSASKAGVVGVTATMAKEFGRFNIRCNAVAPGMVETPMLRNNPSKIIQGYVQLCAMKRLGKPEEVANLCVFLGSDASSYINGETITIHGGKL